MPEVRLDRPDRDAMLHPPGRTCFPKPVEVDVFTHWISLAGDLAKRSLPSSFRNGRFTLAAVYPSPQGNTFQLPEEMIIRPAFIVDKDPAIVLFNLLALLEFAYQTIR